MLRGIARGIVLAALAALAGACGSTITSPTTTVATITETYKGTLIPAGAGTFSFTTLTGGSVIATLSAIGPDSGKTVGFSLGNFTSAGVCSVTLDNAAAAQGFSFSANASSIGTYCVRIYDNGNTTTDGIPYTYTIIVTHPQ